MAKRKLQTLKQRIATRKLKEQPKDDFAPLLLSDGRYVFAHLANGKRVGPFNHTTHPNDPYGLPFNPDECIGGKIHIVDNPTFPEPEILEV